MYKDIDGELYQNGQVSANPIRAYDWNVDDMEILEFSDTTVVAEMSTKDVMGEDTGLRQLTLVNENGQWVLTQSFLES